MSGNVMSPHGRDRHVCIDDSRKDVPEVTSSISEL